MTNDPSELLGLIQSFDGAAVGTLPAGMVSVTALSAGMGPPLRVGDLKQDRAATRAYHAARFTMPNDSRDGLEAWESGAGQLGIYQAEAREVSFIDNPEQKPAGFRFTLQWCKVTDDMGEWWQSPSGAIMLNAAVYTPPAPQPAPPVVRDPANANWSEESRIYRRDLSIRR